MTQQIGLKDSASLIRAIVLSDQNNLHSSINFVFVHKGKPYPLILGELKDQNGNLVFGFRLKPPVVSQDELVKEMADLSEEDKEVIEKANRLTEAALSKIRKRKETQDLDLD